MKDSVLLKSVVQFPLVSLQMVVDPVKLYNSLSLIIYLGFCLKSCCLQSRNRVTGRFLLVLRKEFSRLCR